jgi:hypothetical protein
MKKKVFALGLLGKRRIKHKFCLPSCFLISSKYKSQSTFSSATAAFEVDIIISSFT